MKKIFYAFMLLFFFSMSYAQIDVVIDFETGDFSQYSFSTDANYPWTVVEYDTITRKHGMVSGNSGRANTQSSISVTHVYTADGFVSFDARCRGEQYGDNIYDSCVFYIDGETVFLHGSKPEGWNNYSFDVSAGTHTFTWTYFKDNSVNPTGDAFFVDNIVFGYPISTIITFEDYGHSWNIPEGIDYSFDMSHAGHWWGLCSTNTNGSDFSLRSGNSGISDSYSSFSINYNFTVGGYISFEANCMGESNFSYNYDKCIFSIDGEEKFAVGSWISGWREYHFDVLPGEHTFTWKYTKDYDYDATGDGFYIDNIAFHQHETYTYPIASTANWYEYVYYDNESEYQQDYICFSMQNLSAFTVSAELMPHMDAATCVNESDIYFIDYDNGDLYRAQLNNQNRTISEPEKIVNDFAEGIVKSMAYNPIDNKVYFLDLIGDSIYLRAFSIETPEIIENFGTISKDIFIMAVNGEGYAYGIGYDENLYRIFLENDPEAVLIGSTGLHHDYTHTTGSLAFDTETDELFMIYTDYDKTSFYYVDCASGTTAYIGQKDDGRARLTGLFMAHGNMGVPSMSVSKEKLCVYPNPANDKLYIDGVDGKNVKVYDNMGRLVMNEIYQGSLNIKALPNGIYVVAVGNSAVKFVKE